MKRYELQLPDALFADLEYMCRKRGKKISELTRELFRKEIEKWKKKKGL